MFDGMSYFKSKAFYLKHGPMYTLIYSHAEFIKSAKKSACLPTNRVLLKHPY